MSDVPGPYDVYLVNRCELTLSRELATSQLALLS